MILSRRAEDVLKLAHVKKVHLFAAFVCFSETEERMVDAPIVNQLCPAYRTGYAAGGYQTDGPSPKGTRVILAKIALVIPPTELGNSHASSVPNSP